eukprot:214780-Prymnesium_polylepis.1
MSTRAASRYAIANLKLAAAEGRWEDSEEDESDPEFVHSRTGLPGSSVDEAVGAPAADTEAAAAL